MATPDTLEVRGITRSFEGRTVLDGVTFEVAAGQVLGFLGPNGAGKTTTMRTIMGISEPDAGEVRWKGQPLDAAARQRFGYMPEERGLYPRMRLLDQLAYLGELHGLTAADARRRSQAWLDRLGLGDRATAAVQHLSHGNQQRAQLIAALVHEPEVLVLDEPFSGLDPVAADALADVLRELAAAGCAVVLSSHQLDLVESLCETVAMLHGGRVVMAGEVRALRRAATGRTLHVRVAAARGGERSLSFPLAPGDDPSAAVAAAQQVGDVLELRLEPPHLSELFREAVAA